MGIICAQGGQPSVKKYKNEGLSSESGSTILDVLLPPQAEMSKATLNNITTIRN